MWFQRLMGFAEQSPEHVRSMIEHRGEYLVSRANGRRVRCGWLSTPSLAELRAAAAECDASQGGQRSSVREVVGDVAGLHRDEANAGALVQAASQFNLLEMAHPSVTPEAGVGIYEGDATQGPACAVACGGGTIFRNYFVEVGDQRGQTASAQINCAGELLAELGGPEAWTVRNGYALPTTAGLAAANARLASSNPRQKEWLRGLLRVGVQHEVEVVGTDHCVTQVYGSALPVAYGEPPSHLWEPVARLVLEASYEATLRVARQHGIRRVLLTLLGGGVFGNEPSWIADSIVRAVRLVDDLDIRIVSFRRSSPTVRAIVAELS